jgi:hypothetical protein
MEQMTIEAAREIVRACVRNRMAISMGTEVPPLPQVSLAEMLEANRIVEEAREYIDAEGVKRIMMIVDPRGIAASYALEQYGGMEGVLGAIGYGGLVRALDDERVKAALEEWVEENG